MKPFALRWRPSTESSLDSRLASPGDLGCLGSLVLVNLGASTATIEPDESRLIGLHVACSLTALALALGAEAHLLRARLPRNPLERA